MKAQTIVLFGILCHVMVCLATFGMFSLLDGGSFTSHRAEIGHLAGGKAAGSRPPLCRAVALWGPAALRREAESAELLGQCLAPLPALILEEELEVNKGSHHQQDLLLDKGEDEEAVGDIHTEEKPYVVIATPKVIGTGVLGKADSQLSLHAQEARAQDQQTQTEPPPLSAPELGPSSSSVAEEELDGEKQEEGEDEEGDKGDIVSFSQWAEKQADQAGIPVREAEKKLFDSPQIVGKASPAKVPGIKLTKNFASPDCTAKIVGANPEAQGSGNVITSSRDDYLLNKCSDRAWFVVELCESIKALKVQLANFELYSSSPREFRVSISNVFPGREKDWVEFGTFLYEDERTVQTFKNEEGILGKYVKAEILSHHGAEHYCPISIFKVFGISEIDLISEEDIDDDEGDDEPVVVEPEPEDHHTPENPIVKSVKSIGDAVVAAIRNVVYKNPQNLSLAANLNESSLTGATMRHHLRFGEGGNLSSERIQMVSYLLATQYSTLRQYLYTMSVRSVLMESCTEYGISMPYQPTYHKQSWHWVEFLKTVHGKDFILALCNVLSIELGLSPLTRPNTTTDFIIVTPDNKNNGDGAARRHGSGSINQSLLAPGSENNSQTVILSVGDELAPFAKPPDGSLIGEESDIPGSVSGVHTNVSSNSNLGGFTDVPRRDESRGESGSTGGFPIAAEEASVRKDHGGGSLPVLIGTNGGDGGGGKQAPQQGGRETTWQKLSNRIKALERNVSLSTGFLEELSLKYIRQIEELNGQLKGTSEAIALLQRREEACRARSQQLERRLEEAAGQLGSQLAGLQEEVMARHGLLMLLEVLLLGLMLFWCSPPSQRTATKKDNQEAAVPVIRRLSLDTQRAEKAGKQKEGAGQRAEPRRRSSIEVGFLTAGHLGSMIESVSNPNLKRKQKKRRKRRDMRGNPADSLRNVAEESDEEVYQTYHGKQPACKEAEAGRPLRSCWSDTEHPAGQRKSINDVEAEAEQQVLLDRTSAGGVLLNGRSGGSTTGSPSSSSVQGQHQHWHAHVQDVLKSTRFLVDQVAGRREGPDTASQRMVIGTSAKGRSAIRSREVGRSAYRSPQIAVNNIKISNMYGILNHSVHDTDTSRSCSDTDTPAPGKHNGTGGLGARSSKNKFQRSKSTSPGRQANLLKKQKVMFKNFRPEQADWLHPS